MENKKLSVRDRICDFFQWNNIRSRWGLVYVIFGICVLLGWLSLPLSRLLPLLPSQLLSDHLKIIFWCIGWAAMGIGAGLVNSSSLMDKPRPADDPLRKDRHYLFYYGFILVVATITALIAYAAFEQKSIGSYAVAALSGIIIGFIGECLTGKFNQILEKFFQTKK